MKKVLQTLMLTCLTVLICTGNVWATSYDYGDATGYGTAKNQDASWQRLGTGWSSESSQRTTDTYDDGVAWSTDGGLTWGNDAITVGDTVTFKFTMYKEEWGRHLFDALRVWIDWDQDYNFSDDGVFYQNAWYFQTDSGDAGQTPTTPYAYGDGLAQIYKTFYFTINDIDVDPGDYWLRARVVCSADIYNNINNLTSTGTLYQGETEDYKITVNNRVPEPASLLLLCMGLLGLAGARRKINK